MRKEIRLLTWDLHKHLPIQQYTMKRLKNKTKKPKQLKPTLCSMCPQGAGKGSVAW